MASIYCLKNQNNPQYLALIKVLFTLGVTIKRISMDSCPGAQSYVLLPVNIVSHSEYISDHNISMAENIAIAGRFACPRMNNRFLIMIPPYIFTPMDKTGAYNKGMDIATDLCSLLDYISIQPSLLSENEIKLIKESQFDVYVSFIRHEIKANRIDGLLPQLKKCLALASKKGLIDLKYNAIDTINAANAVEHLSTFL